MLAKRWLAPTLLTMINLVPAQVIAEQIPQSMVNQVIARTLCGQASSHVYGATTAANYRLPLDQYLEAAIDDLAYLNHRVTAVALDTMAYAYANPVEMRRSLDDGSFLQWCMAVMLN
jgi:hypothetical protein